MFQGYLLFEENEDKNEKKCQIFAGNQCISDLYKLYFFIFENKVQNILS